MDVETMLAHCLGKPGAWPDNPWDHEHPGVKGGPTREVADEWIGRFPGDVTVMRYIGRSGWNNMAFGGAIPDDELLEAVDESYRLVVSKLPKRSRPDGWDT